MSASRSLFSWVRGGRLILAAAAFGLLSLPSFARAQGPGGMERFFERLDRDGNRTLDPDELNQLQGPFRGMLEGAGVDLSRPIRIEDLAARAQARVDQYRNGGGGERPREESRGESDRDRDRGRDRDRDRDRSSSDSDSSRSSGDRRDQGRSESSRASTSGGKSKPLVKKEKTRIPLPSDYTAGDADRDGQIALYEWKLWKGRAAMSEFAKLDRDADGFLTPRELASIKSSTPAATTTEGTTPAATTLGTTPEGTTPAADPVATTKVETADGKPAEAKPSEGTTTSAPTTTTPAGSTPASTTSANTSPTTPAPAASTPAASTPAETGPPLTGETADSARRFFTILDRDRNRQISPQEWTASTRIRGMFTTGKVDLSQPMTERDFVSHYVRLTEAGAK